MKEYPAQPGPSGPAAAALSLFICLYLFSTPVHCAQSNESSWSMPDTAGPLEVTVSDLVLTDTARDKDLELRVYQPQSSGPFPVIIFSHGAGGSRASAADLMEWWSANGYLVVCPTHADSIELYRRTHPGEVDQWREDNGRLFMMKMLRNIARNPDDWAQRAADVSFVLNSLPALELELPALAGNIDYGSIGMAGHSYGAFTTMLVGGAVITPSGGDQTYNYRDDRFAALLVLSGQGVGRLGLTENSWEGIDQPLMVMSGSRDNAVGGMDIASRRDPFDYAPPGNKYLVWIEDAYHSSFTGKLAATSAIDRQAGQWVEWIIGGDDASGYESTDQQAVFNCVKSATLAYWDYHLKYSDAAGAWLTGDNLTQASGAVVEFREK